MCYFFRHFHIHQQVKEETVYNNNNDFFCANILRDQAQCHDKTKGLSKLVIESNA